MDRLLTVEEIGGIMIAGKYPARPMFGDLEPYLKAQDAKTLKAVGESIEAKLMLKNKTIISGKTLTKVITDFVEALKRGDWPG